MCVSWCYRHVLRPVLFAQNSEDIHDRTLRLLGIVARNRLLCEAMDWFLGAEALPVRAFGLEFPNPVGLAAGMDKHADALPAWAAMGFGHSELGGVTWLAQPGNPQPRMFRAIPDEALVNRMGFNNAGAQALARRLAAWRASGRWPAHPVGINLGKSKATPLDQAAQDYAESFRLLWPLADFFVVNVSSPNTPNLRELQNKTALDEILVSLQEVNVQLAATLAKATPSPQSATGNPPSAKPILVKVAPDLSLAALDEILELVAPRQIAGIVATNTTVTRPETIDEQLKKIYTETGGLSGRPLRQRSTEVIRHLFRQSRGRLPIIGVGGIFNAEDAWEKITAGATLVQVYTGLVYEGPSVVKRIVTGLRERLASQGMSSLSQAVGLHA
jgi:dihydroorotate dehydrogenase